ncbi:galactose-1-phosphate uridylyltransferase [Clostridium lundense]|uniref:galactose-1-phosphate uridylyltransferase n=1 Tax=Clostridium lundense TaxID=319475 RepID=UPI0004823348|nr:DUF4931 domain-containing protein [Clostridium lundense]
MSNYRKEECNRKYVIVSEKRVEKPYDFNIGEEKNDVSYKEDCPFCPGNESQSDNSVYEIKDPWQVRVIPNKYPCIENYTKQGQNVFGYHYVVVESREHNKKIHEFKEDEIEKIIKSYIDISNKLYKDDNVKYIQIFKNYKREGGASLAHPHSQIIALNIMPEKIKHMLDYNHNFYVNKSECIYCKTIREELKNNIRLIYENDKFICFCPEASIFSYEITIIKKDHVQFLNFTEEDITSLCQCIFKIINKIYSKLGDIALNICLYFIKEENDYFHFSVGIYPRIASLAGFEISTGIIQNPISPEKAAKELKIEQEE